MKTVLTILLASAPLLLLAQSSKVISGKVAYEQQLYDEALQNLNEALKNPTELKDKYYGKALLYKGKTLIAQYRDAAINRNQELLIDDNLLIAYSCLMKVYEVTEDNGTLGAADKELHNLQYSLFALATAKIQLKEYSVATNYLNACKAINKKFDGTNTYSYYNAGGLCYLYAGDTLQATMDLETSKDAFATNPPENIDFGVGYVYYYLAFIYRYQQNDIDKALKTTQSGIAALDAEKERMLTQSDKYDASDMAQLTESYSSVKDALQRFELDIYNNYPEKFEEALATFQRAVAANPNDETILLVYGTLLEQQDPDAGLEVYKKVIALNPNNTTALFNAGANRVNQGVAYARLANEESDYVKSIEWQKKVDEEFRLALPYLEKCAALQPENMYVLDALLQVTVQLNEMDKYTMYKEKRAALRGY